MNWAQFIVFSALLFSCPYLPPVIAGLNARALCSGSDAAKPPRILRYCLAEVAIAVLVLGACFYSIDFGAFNGFVDDMMFRKSSGAPPYVFHLWDVTRYGVAFLGIMLSSFVSYSGFGLKNVRRSLAISLQGFAGFGLIYAVSIPVLMESFLGAIEDSHLFS
jgi:hypothetical protein